MKCVSLFAGIGGFDLALTRLGHEIVWANEWDKYAAQTYEKNFNTENDQSARGFRQEENISKQRNSSISSKSDLGQHSESYVHPRVDTRNITTVPTTDIPNHDLLVGGFPCQAFSVAGLRRGFSETRGTLFFEIARILKDKKPNYFILENVKGLLSHDNGNTFKTIISTLTELGYDLQWQVLNSKNFGVLQNRERVFIVGNLRGTSRPQVFPIPCDNGTIAPGPVTSQQWKNRSTGSLYVAKVGTYRTHKDGQGFREVKSGLSPTIPARAREDGSGQPVITVPVLTPDRLKKRQNGRRFKENGEPAFTLTGQDKHGVYDGMRIRRLTPTECERLQGFPDGWTEGVSDTQRYKQLGNAVTINVVYEIARRLII